MSMMSFGFGKLADLLHKGERFPEIAKSKRALDAACIIAQYPLRRLALETQGFITRKRRDAAATRRLPVQRVPLTAVPLLHQR